MLLTFLFHRVNVGKYSSNPEIIKNLFAHLKKHYKIVTPENKLNPFRQNICLTFDDGYFDFYHHVFPLLKELNIKAVLSIPVKFILEDTDIDSKIRLNVSYHEAMKNDTFIKKAPFCTWKELKEMSDSNLVYIASHSYSHKNMLQNDVDLEKEIIFSKRILEEKLKKPIDTFVYPLGKFNDSIHKFVKIHYKYVMRIGSAINFSWQNMNKITYRIICDDLKRKNQFLKPYNYISYLWFFFLNTFRKR